ncbi:YdeI/OmpD-associated family protein [Maritalea myrionectae]|uniref:YdeI/OmpD-associated family protein n=1 Tax=Maritalea myrionectae TaxID=454601 RepID=UPI00041D492F|nr:YdeI/OmpD-associated family protein [Maritalea myrionectae]
MAKTTKLENLQRDIQPMPEAVAKALQDNGLQAAYEERPAYQRNDYLSWINRAVRPATKDKRLNQMLEELAAGDKYMGMKWKKR